VQSRESTRTEADIKAIMGEEEASEAGNVEYLFDTVLGPDVNLGVLQGSVLSQRIIVQSIIYLLAAVGVAFIFYAKASELGVTDDAAHGSASQGSARRMADHMDRKLGGEASPLLTYVAYSVACAGVIAFFLNMLRLPLLLGYLLAGVVLGPQILDIVHEHNNIADVSSLGLVLLLFMIGLELDVSELFKMGKVVILTGCLQFPICAGITTSLFFGMEAAGLNFGRGKYASLYCGLCTGISSTMIVVKMLSDIAEMDTMPGRLTVGILVFQDIWAIVILAIQPDMSNPEILGLLRTFAMVTLLICLSLAYAKAIMPAVFMFASKSIELMLVVALAWCFLVCCFATLPFIDLSMELAALISGIALPTFPYSAEFNGKIKYIRDFFITLYFVDLGVQIPPPTIEAIGVALFICVSVLLIRWVGIFLIVWLAGGGTRLACLATINLSQISEFALVICSLGLKYGDVEEDTLAILTYTFAILGLLSQYGIKYNYQIYGQISKASRSMRRTILGRKRRPSLDDAACHWEGEGDPEHPDRSIVFLGFHKSAALLIAHLEHYNPHLLARIHIIDYHEHLMANLRRRGVTCAYGDISSPDVLEHAHHGEVRLVISSIPDHQLRGVTNLRLLQIGKQVWPKADFIATATSPSEARALYDNGADYVLRVSKLCAEKLSELILDHSRHTVHHHHAGEETRLSHAFDHHKDQDNSQLVAGIHAAMGPSLVE